MLRRHVLFAFEIPLTSTTAVLVSSEQRCREKFARRRLRCRSNGGR